MNHTAPNHSSPGPLAGGDRDHDRTGADHEATARRGPHPQPDQPPQPDQDVAGLIDALEAADPADAPEVADRIARLLADRLDRDAQPADASAPDSAREDLPNVAGERPA